MCPLDLATSNEFLESVNWTLPQQDRDFSGRHFADWSLLLYPRDVNMAEDSSNSEFIKNVQRLMKSNPLKGKAYTGPIDGKINDDLLASIVNFEAKLQLATGQRIIGTINRGKSIDQAGLSKAIKILREHLGMTSDKTTKEKTDKTVDPQLVKSDVIKSFQAFFSLSHPIIGKLYSGPINGEINDNLTAAAQQAESILANEVGNPSIKGALWNNSAKNFNTSAGDLKNAIDIIVTSRNAQK